MGLGMRMGLGIGMRLVMGMRLRMLLASFPRQESGNEATQCFI